MGEPLDARRLLAVETMESEMTILSDTPFVERLVYPNSASFGAYRGRQLRRPKVRRRSCPLTFGT